MSEATDKDCDNKTHCRFTTRCINKGIIPVSVRLKTTVKSEIARNIIRKAEMDLLQAGFNSNNNFLDNNNKQIDRCRSQLASMVTTTIMEECQNHINKVREFSHFQIRDRQINKFNRLVEKQVKGGGRLANSANTLPNHQQGRSVDSSCNPHPGWSPTPGNSATTAPDGSQNSQLGDVPGSTINTGLGPRGTTVAVPLQPQLEPPHPQLGSSTDTPLVPGAENIDDPSCRLFKNLSSTPHPSSKVLINQRT